jgi:hypothetical protein
MMNYRDSLCRLIDSLRLPSPVVAEIGVHRGRTSECLLHRFPELELWMVDPWLSYAEATKEQQSNFKVEAYERTRRYFNRRTIVEQPSADAAALVPDCDLVFIDADHSREACYADCRTWLPKVKPGGILCGHDFGKGLGVDQAVIEWAEQAGVQFTLTDGHIWVVRT